MAASGVFISVSVGFASENLDLDGYRPVESGQARNVESGKNRDCLRRMYWVSAHGGETLGDVKQGCGSMRRGFSLGAAGDRAAMDGAGSESGRNCGAQ
jgi:hypothetical protein